MIFRKSPRIGSAELFPTLESFLQHLLLVGPLGFRLMDLKPRDSSPHGRSSRIVMSRSNSSRFYFRCIGLRPREVHRRMCYCTIIKYRCPFISWYYLNHGASAAFSIRRGGHNCASGKLLRSRWFSRFKTSATGWYFLAAAFCMTSTYGDVLCWFASCRIRTCWLDYEGKFQ